MNPEPHAATCRAEAEPSPSAAGNDTGRAIRLAVPLAITGAALGLALGVVGVLLHLPRLLVPCLALLGLVPAGVRVVADRVAGDPPSRRRAWRGAFAAHAAASAGLSLVLLNAAYLTGTAQGGPSEGLATLSTAFPHLPLILAAALIFGVPFGAAVRGRVEYDGVDDGGNPQDGAPSAYQRDLSALTYLLFASPIVGTSFALGGVLLDRLHAFDSLVAIFFGSVGVLAASALATSLLFALDSAADGVAHTLWRLRRGLSRLR